MANRPVFVVSARRPYYTTLNAEFPWAGGFAASQKQKNIAQMHRCFERAYPGKKALEISSKSTEPWGIGASAFHLLKNVPSLGKKVPVENVFQAAKVFSGGGPYRDLLDCAPIDAKRDGRLSSSGELRAFRFEGVDYPLIPRTIFYDFIYINALLENPELAAKLVEYDGFTDIAFNPEKSLNCQARSAAIFVALHRLGKLEDTRSFHSFLALFATTPAQKAPASSQTALRKPEPSLQKLHIGDHIQHPAFGIGKIVEMAGTTIKVTFESVGEKVLGIPWVLEHCEIQEKE